MLKDVYKTIGAPAVLYDFLLERSKLVDVNISHVKMPSYEEHLEFFNSKPYRRWYFIFIATPSLSVFNIKNSQAIGSIYLTHNNEIGIFVSEKWREKGYAKKAIEKLMYFYPEPRYLANINPNNTKSIELFSSLGFVHIQNTYELRNVDKSGK